MAESDTTPVACAVANRWIDLTTEALDWYWTMGRQRTGAHALTLTWLDSLYAARASLTAGRDGLMTSKPSVAVWGPSQTGKSTLISYYVDRHADAEGRGSALHWPQGQPARFVVKDPNLTDVVVLNPFHFKSDASGCVTRFVLRSDEQVPDHEHPVELRLAQPAEVMHSLAAGYLTECTPASVGWDSQRVQQKLGALPAGDGGHDRTAVEAIEDFLDVLDLLIRSGHPRYDGLGSGGQWQNSLRRMILDSPSLVGNSRAVLTLAATMLWDDQRRITDLYERILRQAEVWRTQWHDPVFCSFEVAAALLDIESYAVLKQADDPAEGVATAARRQRFREFVLSLSWEQRPDHVVLGRKLTHRLVQSEEDFGLLQGLIWELVVPLRRAALEAPDCRPFLNFLERADLVDFPGVSLGMSGPKAAQLDPDTLPADQEHLLLTRLLKRGKTACVVASYARSLSIDAFLLLTRAEHFPAQPVQLYSGIETWWRCLAPDYNVNVKPVSPPPLPLFLGMTFFAQVVNTVAKTGVGNGLRPLFEMLQKLGPLADPQVSTTMATTYPQFDEGRLLGTEQAIGVAAEQIAQDAAFQRQFPSPDSVDSFKAMIADGDGGVGFLLKVIAQRLNPERRQLLLLDRYRKTAATVRDLLSEPCPGIDDTAIRRELLERVIRSIEESLTLKAADESIHDPAAQVSHAIRRLVDVNADDLDPLPLFIVNHRVAVRPYVEKQFQNWTDSKRSVDGFAEIGLGDPVERGRLLHYLVEAGGVEDVVGWVRENYGHLDSMSHAIVAQRDLAVRLANACLRRSDAGSHAKLRGEGGVLERLGHYAELEESQAHPKSGWRESPHYVSVIEPFIKLLNDLAHQSAAGRPPQPGDAEITALHAQALTLAHQAVLTG